MHVLTLISPTAPRPTLWNLVASAVEEFWLPLVLSGVYIVWAAWRRKRQRGSRLSPLRLRGLPLPVLLMAACVYWRLEVYSRWAEATGEWLFYWALVGTLSIVLVWIGLLLAWVRDLKRGSVAPFAWVSALVVTLSPIADYGFLRFIYGLFAA